MRIEIDEETEKVLNKIRREVWSITGKGHSDTVRYLARHYEETKEITEQVEEALAKIHTTIKEAFKEALRDVFTNILK